MEQFWFHLKNKVLIVQLVNVLIIIINSSSAYKKSNAYNQLGRMLFVVGYLSFDISEMAIIAKDYRNVVVVFVLFRRNVWDPQIADDHLYQNGPRTRLRPQDRILGQEEDRKAAKTSTLL